jgi:hypothetical protein
MEATSLAIIAVIGLVALLALLAHGRRTGAYPEVNFGSFLVRFRRIDDAPSTPAGPPAPRPEGDDGAAADRAS